MAEVSAAEMVQKTRIIAGAILMATIGYAVVGTILILGGTIPSGGLSELDSQTALILKVVLLFAGIGSLAMSFVIRRILESKVPEGDAALPVRFRNMIVVMALGESAGVMGFVVALLTADAMFALLLWGAAIAACILHFPTASAFGADS